MIPGLYINTLAGAMQVGHLGLGPGVAWHRRAYCSCFTRGPPAHPCGTLFGLFYFFPVFRAFVPLSVFVLVNHHFPVVLGESKVEREHERQGMVRVKAGTGW